MTKISNLLRNCVYSATLAIPFVLFSCNNAGEGSEADDSTAMGGDSAMHGDMHSDTSSVPMKDMAQVTIDGTYADTSLTGMAKFSAVDGKVNMELEITCKAKAGKNVAVHLHEHGDCGDNGKMSHGHWNPTNAEHGKWGSSAFHIGDIGNVKLDADGKGTLSMSTDLWTLGGTADKNILGKALIVHGGEDDYTTQPTGNAGSRIGCGVIQ